MLILQEKKHAYHYLLISQNISLLEGRNRVKKTALPLWTFEVTCPEVFLQSAISILSPVSSSSSSSTSTACTEGLSIILKIWNSTEVSLTPRIFYFTHSARSPLLSNLAVNPSLQEHCPMLWLFPLILLLLLLLPLPLHVTEQTPSTQLTFVPPVQVDSMR